MSLLDIVEEEFGAAGRGSKGSKSAKSTLSDLKDLKEPQPKRSKLREVAGNDRAEAPSGRPIVESIDQWSKRLRDTPDELRRVAEDDWAEESSTPAKLIGFADSLAIAQIRETGRIPDNYTAITNCKVCGPVPVHEGLPRTIAQCVWCMNGLTAPPIPGVKE